MANTINDLYLKYTNKVGKTLESDRYFQYLFEMVQAGNNEFKQNNRILHKIVDERWLTTIEESLDSINAIIEKPRRFVTTSEEVVPVALAKKITADSVRHLSMNTQFIASSEDGDIQPTRVLNVTTEETYDLYENRFIYHLIQRLVTFIDKRTDIIFWSTGDETTNTLSYTSKVDDAYEEIEYKIEMSVKNRQSFAENDNDNMSVFMRIDRVRRLVMAIRNSSFCEIMAGCAKVRSPIQRTNLIMKDPHYRTCYKLWQFLESYEEVGYTIEEEDTAMEFDEEYMIQMYTNLITNYTVFKSLMEADPRKLEQVATKKRRPVKPKFIKKIEEELVDSPDIPDVEIRKVFVEEVTQAQLDAEAKLAEEQDARQRAEQELEDLDGQMIGLQQQVANLMFMNQEAETAALEEREARETAEKKATETIEELERKLAEALASREQAENLIKQAQQERLELESRIEKAIEAKQMAENTARSAFDDMRKAQSVAAESEAAREKAEQEAKEAVAKAEQEAKETVAEAELKAENAINAANSKADSAIAAASARVAEAEERAAQTKLAAENDIAKAQKEAAAAIEETNSRAEAEIATAVKEAEDKVRSAEQDAEARVARAKTEAEAEIAKTKAEAEGTMESVRKQSANLISEMEAQYKKTSEETIAQMRTQTDTEIASVRTRAEADVTKAKSELALMEADRNEAVSKKNEMESRMNEAKEASVIAEEKAATAYRSAYEAEKKADAALVAKEKAESDAQAAEAKVLEAERRVREAEEKMLQATKAREKAEARAEAKTLSHYIVNRLSDRKKKDNEEE